jgi:hypothetical protein
VADHASALELKLIRRSDGVELDLFPLQGLWTVAQYLTLTNQTNHLIGFSDGETYAPHGIFQRGEHAASTLLTGFTVSVDAVFDAT